MYITSAASLRFDITYYTNRLRNEQNRRLHDNSWLMTSSNRGYLFMMITSFSLIICHSCRCFQPSIYIFPTNLTVSLILPMIRLLQNFYHYYHGDCRILADGTGIFHLECCYCFIMVSTVDLDPVTLGIASEHIYTTFFYTSTSHTLCQQSEETLFGHFVIALNAAFIQNYL